MNGEPVVGGLEGEKALARAMLNSHGQEALGLGPRLVYWQSGLRPEPPAACQGGNLSSSISWIDYGGEP